MPHYQAALCDTVKRDILPTDTHTQTVVSGTGQNPGLDQCCVLTINDKICNKAKKLTTNDKILSKLSFIVKTQVQCLNIYCNAIFISVVVTVVLIL